MTDPQPVRRYRFGVFEADGATGELRRQGVRVKLAAQPFQVLCMLLERPGEPGADPQLRIIVDDDGRGLSAAERTQVSRRGQRLDESKPGSGLGLSIVVELASLYGGVLTLGTAPIGGLRAELALPAG